MFALSSSSNESMNFSHSSTSMVNITEVNIITSTNIDDDENIWGNIKVIEKKKRKVRHFFIVYFSYFLILKIQ